MSLSLQLKGKQRLLISGENGQKGFSLVEILLVLLVSGAIMAVIVNLPSIISVISSGNYESIAKEITAKEIEVIRTTAYASLQNSTITDSRLTKLPQGSGNVVITPCSAPVCTQDEITKKVTVTVNWVDRGEAKKVEMVTLVSDGGLK